LLAVEAVKVAPTPDALFALRRALDVSPLLARLPSLPPWTGWSGGGEFMAFSPDGRELAEGSLSGAVTRVDAHSFAVRRRLRIAGARSTPIVGFSPDGRSLAVATDHDVELVDAVTGVARMSTHEGQGTDSGLGLVYYAANFAFARDGSEVYFADGVH